MSDYVCFLVTVFYERQDTLLRCALKIKRDTLSDEAIEEPESHEARTILHELLPLHVRNCGPIVEVQRIFEVEVMS